MIKTEQLFFFLYSSLLGDHCRIKVNILLWKLFHFRRIGFERPKPLIIKNNFREVEYISLPGFTMGLPTCDSSVFWFRFPDVFVEDVINFSRKFLNIIENSAKVGKNWREGVEYNHRLLINSWDIWLKCFFFLSFSSLLNCWLTISVEFNFGNLKLTWMPIEIFLSRVGWGLSSCSIIKRESVKPVI